MAKVWIDTTSGTWGVVDDSQGRLVIVETDDVFGISDSEDFVYSHMEQLSDAEIVDLADKFGKPIRMPD